MFPKPAHEAHAAHAEHVHKHFDLSLAGLNLEGWGVVFVLGRRVRAVRHRAGARAPLCRRCGSSSAKPLHCCALTAVCVLRVPQFVRAWRMYDRLQAEHAKKKT
jgi:hypothetical protein